jgi:purine-binding chemotaxis protein CheW
MKAMASSQQFCTFIVQGQFFGVPVQRVQEVIRYQQMTRVPLVSDSVRGLINLRGQIVTAIDLRKCLGLPPREADRVPMNVIIRSDDGPISLLVDDIGDVLEVGREALEPPPETLQGPTRAMVRGVYKLPGRLLLSLDVQKAFQAAEMRDATGAGR